MFIYIIYLFYFFFRQYSCLVVKCKYISLVVRRNEWNKIVPTSDFIESDWHLILRLDRITNKITDDCFVFRTQSLPFARGFSGRTITHGQAQCTPRHSRHNSINYIIIIIYHSNEIKQLNVSAEEAKKKKIKKKIGNANVIRHGVHA